MRLLLFGCLLAGAAQAKDLWECQQMEGHASDAALLACYRSVPKESLPAKSASLQPSTPKAAYESTPSLPAKSGTHQPPPTEGDPPSLLAEEWDPSGGMKYAYKQNYLLPIANSSNPNNAPTSPNPNNRVPFSYPLSNTEVKFQFSMKGCLLGFGGDGGRCSQGNTHSLWLAYTQQSLWQAYDGAHSSPFRESNYEPEFIYSGSWVKDKLPGLDILNVALVHQSNGQSNPRSRSWNRVYVQPGFERDRGDDMLVVQPKVWWRIPEKAATNDNPDITHYLGYGEVQLRYLKYSLTEEKRQLKYQLSALARIRSIQFDADYPIDKSDIDLHFQYFAGYGESLIDYNQRHSTWGIGVSLPVGQF